MTNTSSQSHQLRLAAAVVTVFIPLAAVLGSFAAWRDHLPPVLASHWSDLGPADGVMTVAQFLTVALTMTGGAAIAAVVLSLVDSVSVPSRRIGLLVAGIVAGAGAESWLVSAVLTARAGDPNEVVLGAWSLLGVVGAAYGLIPFFVAPKPKPRPASQDSIPRIDLPAGQNVAWSRSITANLFLWACLVLVATGIVIVATAGVSDGVPRSVLGLVALAAGVIVLASLSRLQITADWRGLRVVSVLSRITLKRIRLEDIATLEVSTLVPSEWGGWGYRVVPGRSALILRRGPGLIITTVDQKQFAVTLDDPEVPAALLATLRDRHGMNTGAMP